MAQHECEVADLAGMMTEMLLAMLHGLAGTADVSAGGIKQVDGHAAVAQLVSELERYRRPLA